MTANITELLDLVDNYASVTEKHFRPSSIVGSLAQDAQKMAAALREVLELHEPFETEEFYNGMDGESLMRWVVECEGCHLSGGTERYPCPTVQAIIDALEDHDE